MRLRNLRRLAVSSLLFLIVLLSPARLFAQQKYPALTSIITFENLTKYADKRLVEWINPNGEKDSLTLVQMTVPVTARVKELTGEFLHNNYGIDSIWLQPRMIVFHAMGDGDLKTCLEVSSFLNDEMPSDWGTLPNAGKLSNGAHFIIDRDGTVICLTPPRAFGSEHISYRQDDHHWMVRRHQDANPIAIGIENVTPKGDLTSLTEKQIESNAKLARWLITFEDNRINYLTSHHQFNSDIHYDLFLKAFKLKHLQKAYRTKGRKDIGDENLKKIIELVNEYGFEVYSFVGIK